jgi:DNA-binding NarL/FixJ family response regulator
VTDPESMTRVLIADDHASFRSGLRALLETAGDMAVVGEAGTGDEAVRRTSELQPTWVPSS